MGLINSCVSFIKGKLLDTDERSAKMRKNSMAMLVIRGLSILVSLASAPIMLHHVDRADYGVLMTLTSLVSWVGLMDIGLGNGLRNKLPKLLVTGDTDKAKEAVSSCYAALAIYVSALIVLFLTISPFCDWLRILNSPGSSETEIRNLACVVFVAFCIHFLLGLINSILFAYQLPAINSIFTFVGQIVSLIALIIQVYVFHVTSVFQIGAINCLIPVLVLFGGSVFLFKGRLKEVAPAIKYVRLKSVNGILSLGIKFFILQVITIVLFQANALIITQAVGPEAVVEYNMAFRYISVITMIFNIIITPIWSATTDAYVRKDFEWIKRTLQYEKNVFFVTICVGIVMFLVSKFVYSIWLGDEYISIPYSTTGLVLLYLSFEMLYKMYGTIINGTGKVLAQMIITGIIAIIYIPLALFLGKRFGLAGVLIANSIVFFANYVWSKIQCLKIINQTATGIWDM